MTKLETIIYAKNLILAAKSQNENAFDVIIESLDKQIPIKSNGRECTRCGGDVGIYQVPYCQCCGQALELE